MPAHFFILRKMPFLRLVLSLSAGILVEQNYAFPLSSLFLLLGSFVVLLLVHSFLSLKSKYILEFSTGIVLHLSVVLGGAILTWKNDIHHDVHWFGKNYTDSNYIALTLREPLQEKANSFKAEASVMAMFNHSKPSRYTGQVLIYFKKEAMSKKLSYGSMLLLRGHIQPIRNGNNPGSFNYHQYCIFHGITHQVYLGQQDYILLEEKHKDYFTSFLFRCRNSIVTTLKKNIKGTRESGLAEALLIGYKDDLDKDLVQSYTNTGVVHIIAISGMHLALIYGLLVLITRPIKKYKKLNWLRVTLILCGLWIFSLLAGAQASVLRSALMFTCLALGELMQRKSPAYNSLALSAFILLCYNPFLLWDAGFQLSYAAVLSILLFYKPIYNWFYFPNPLIDNIWKTIAISLSAQVLTTPVSLFHFHQFPLLFLLTNLVAVPLSSIILFAEIFLCLVAWFPPGAQLIGKLTTVLLQAMNAYIERLERVSFALWEGFSISFLQTVLLLVYAALLAYWLMKKNKKVFLYSLFVLLLFVIERTRSFIHCYQQEKLVVYQVPKHMAVELIKGRSAVLLSDTALLKNVALQNFHLRPAQVLHRINNRTIYPAHSTRFHLAGKNIVLLSSKALLTGHDQIDLLLLSNGAPSRLSALCSNRKIVLVVIDASVSITRARQWKKECADLDIPCYDVVEKGAFVMNL